MTSDEQHDRVDSGPRDAAKGFGFAVLFLAWQVGAVYLSARLLRSGLWAGILVSLAGPAALAVWAWRDAISQLSREQRPLRRLLGLTVRIGCGTAVALILWLISWTAVATMQKEFIGGQKAECLSNVKELTSATLRFADDHNGRLPDAASWADEIAPYVNATAATFRCPSAANKDFAYAYNSSLSGKKLGDIQEPEKVVLIFESDTGRNAAGGPELLSTAPRHFGGDDYGFVDGHCLWTIREKSGIDARGAPIWTKTPGGSAMIRWEP
jgi:hypothetical protein